MLSRADFVRRFPGVCLVAVSKTQPLEAIERLYREGQRDFGENYVQEVLEKAAMAREKGLDEIRWHFVGHLQSNKVKKLVPHVSVIHSVDSFELATKISESASSVLEAFLQINIDREQTKSGLAPERATEVCQRIEELSKVRLLGLMALPKPGRSELETKASFDRLTTLAANCRPWTQGKLSLGTTDDFELAIRAGSTHVRIGRALFGARD